MDINANTYSEVYSFLEVLGYNFINRIPEREYLKIIEKRNQNYNPKYNFNDFNSLTKSAKCLVLAYYYKYCCKTQEEKKEIIEILKNNEKKLNEKYKTIKFKEKNLQNNLNEMKLNRNNNQISKINSNWLVNKMKNIINKIKFYLNNEDKK